MNQRWLIRMLKMSELHLISALVIEPLKAAY